MSKKERELLHDLVSPLMIISGHLEVLMSDRNKPTLSSDCVERIQKCIKALDKMSALIKGRREELKAEELE